MSTMDVFFKENVRIKEEYGQCRCCLAEGVHRDITKEYNWNGIKEIYSDIFLECFNLFLTTNMNVSTLICDSCVARLRDADNFKRMVLSNEKQLTRLLDSEDEPYMFVNVPISEDTLDSTIGSKIGLIQVNSVHHLDGNFHKNVKYEIHDRDLDNERNESMKNNRKGAKGNLITYMKEKMGLLSNVSTILECSNVTAFKSRSRFGYPCFYCRDIFENFHLLRTHQTVEHKNSDLKKSLKTYNARSLVVYVDVTDLKCTICNQNVSSLKELRVHLTEHHNKSFYKFTERIIPFKFSENHFECQICGFNFETFGAIERHMNTHYRNYACEECGAGFVTIQRLKTHIHAVHNEGHYPCKLCDKVFTTQQRYKGHVDYVHKMMKKLKCQKCPERFADYFVQQKHLVEVHGETPILYKCNVCDRSFNRRYTLSCHMKRRHLEQRDVACDLCPYRCYNKTELKEHMLKHNKVCSFECSVCKKSYSRKKTLNDHMRIHADDRRYECRLCDQKFIHNCSLKTHIKSRHLDVE